MRLGAVAAIAALAASLAVPCYADSLNPIVFSASLGSTAQPEQITSTPYQSSTASVGGSGGTASMSYSLGGDPSLLSEIQSEGGNTGLISSVSLFYQFEVLAPTDTTSSVYIAGQGQVDTLGQPAPVVNGTLTERATLTVGPVGVDILGGGGLVASNTGTSSFNIGQTYDVSTNTVYDVSMVTLAEFLPQNGINPPASFFLAQASLDPTITLESSDPADSLEFSPGLLAPTPEPGSLMLTATGLIGIAEALRRRSRRHFAL